MICVGNDRDLLEVALGKDGALAGMKRGAVLVDHTTASADAARRIFQAAKEKGVDFIDAPVSGGQAGAENGKLTVMCGGEADPFARAKPVMDSLRPRRHAARCLGRGPAHQDGEPDLHRGPGAGPVRRHRLRREGGPGRRAGARRDLQGRGAVLADGEPRQDHARAQVRLRLRGRLDAQGPGICLEEAGRNGAKLPVTRIVDGYYAEVQKAGGNRWDTSSLITRL